MKLDLMQRAQTHISDKLSKVLTESYQKEKEILGAVQVSATAAAKIKGLPSALAEVNRVIRAAQTLEQKKRRCHLYRAAR
ncbi:MAG: hypothetical protein NT030_06730, partial [Candidatus Saganbacteria bacterium]|nr:hypothetical protein [Candidatus Saganbacteria bacterium]